MNTVSKAALIDAISANNPLAMFKATRHKPLLQSLTSRHCQTSEAITI